MTESEYLTVSNAAALLGVSRDTVMRAVNDGKLPAYRFRTALLISREDLRNALQRI